MSMTGDSEAVLNQIRDIQGKDIPLEEKNALINKILGNRWVLNNQVKEKKRQFPWKKLVEKVIS